MTELLDLRDIDDVVEVADVIQIGARNMQTTRCFRSGQVGQGRAAEARAFGPLDRGASDGPRAQAQEGNENVMLCEGHPDLRDRLPLHALTWAVPALKELTHRR